MEFKPRQDKESRVNGVSALFEAGKVRLLKDAPWVPDFERELLEFPNSRNDDQVDALTQALIWARDKAERYVVPVMAVSILKAEEDRFSRDEDFGPLDYDEDPMWLS